MKRKLVCLTLCMVLAGLPAFAVEMPEEPAPIAEAEEPVSGRYLVKLRREDGRDAVLQTAEQFYEEEAAGPPPEENGLPGPAPLNMAAPEAMELADGFAVINLPEAVSAERFTRELEQAHPDAVEYVQPDYRLELASLEEAVGSAGLTVTETPAEPERTPDAAEETPEPAAPPERPALLAIEDDLAAAHLVSTGEGVTVAVIDTPVDTDHPALAGRCAGGMDFTENPDADRVHGTAVAGIVAEAAPDAVILPVACFDGGSAFTSDLISAVRFAAEQGADVVNCSWGSADDNRALKEAMAEAGLLFVCAAGNSRQNVDEKPVYPACFPLDNVLSVTAVNADGGLCYFSNFGVKNVDIAAYGRELTCPLAGGETTRMDGTSLAAAYAAGACALAFAMDADSVTDRVTATALRLENLRESTADGRLLSFARLAENTRGAELADVSPAEDFDVHGYQRTPEEDWELFQATENVQVEMGAQFTVVLKADGTVWAWGRNNRYQLGDGTTTDRLVPQQVPGITDVVQISAAGGHTVALKADGSAWGWGYSQYGELGRKLYNMKTPGKIYFYSARFQSLSTGELHTLAVSTDNTVLASGHNSYGELGNGSTSDDVETFREIKDFAGVAAVAAGHGYSIALKSDGTVWSWGDNLYGQCAQKETKYAPAQVSGIDRVTAIDAAENNVVAVKADETVWEWGDTFGVANNYSRVKYSPVRVDGLNQVERAAAGGAHSLAILRDGSLWGWGYNRQGALGNGAVDDKYCAPVQVRRLTGVTSAACGAGYSAAIASGGMLWSWGSNLGNYLGTGQDGKKAARPIAAAHAEQVAAMDAGSGHLAFVKADGTVWGWGTNTDRQLATDELFPILTPVQAEGVSSVSAIAAGANHQLALRADGTVLSWGLGNYGQTGLGSTKYLTGPQPVLRMTNAAAVAVGGDFSVVMKADGTVWTFGYNRYGQLGDNSTVNKSSPVYVSALAGITAVSAGNNHAAALKEDGTVWTWGDNSSGQLGNGTTVNSGVPVQVPGLSGVTAIACGGSHTLALKEDGTLWTWGWNRYGQLGDGTTGNSSVPVQVTGVEEIAAIRASNTNTMVLKTDGTVWVWGDNTYGQIGDGTTNQSAVPVEAVEVSSITEIACGGSFSAARSADGTFYLWGSASSGLMGPVPPFVYTEPVRLNSRFNDSYGDTRAEAFVLRALSSPIEGAIEFDDDQDWFRLTAPASAQYTFNLSAEKAALIGIYREEDAPVAEDEYAVSIWLEAGETIYIMVRGVRPGESGEYTITVALRDNAAAAANVEAAAGRGYQVAINARGVSRLSEKTFVLRYDDALFSVEDLVLLTEAAETEPGTFGGIEVVSAVPGEIRLKKAAAENLLSMRWSGVVNIIGFRAKQTGAGQITLTVE